MRVCDVTVIVASFALVDTDPLDDVVTALPLLLLPSDRTFLRA